MHDSTYIKELKRRKIIAKRVKCHGNKMHCSIAHPAKEKVVKNGYIGKLKGVYNGMPPPKKENWFRRLLKLLRIIK